MPNNSLAKRLEFLQAAEALKDVLRSAHTSSGRTESTAEHSWRLCLWILVFEDELVNLDVKKLLAIAIIHDMGEAINGDIPAIYQDPNIDKSAEERKDLCQLISPLPDNIQTTILNLWDEYEYARSPEARLVKGFDKLETIMQHNQGKNPANFDYQFNLTYGAKHTSTHTLLQEIRAILDEKTAEHAAQSIT